MTELIPFHSNRVWRTYRGGRTLDKLEGKTKPEDSLFPEDWIGSSTQARNPGRENPAEGLSEVTVEGQRRYFRDVLEESAESLLGNAHVEKFGKALPLLVKYLDSATRLHLQVHPTARFAQERLGEPCGKAEAYHILKIREDINEPYIHLGFQRPPSREQMKNWIQEQDIESMLQTMDRIPVKEGDSLYIPGGMPHAIGEGIFMVEIMEPSDLVVRFEFTRDNFTIPESSRFLNDDIELSLDAFDWNAYPQETIRNRFFPQPRIVDQPNDHSRHELLIGPEQLEAFRVEHATLRDDGALKNNGPAIGIVTDGMPRLGPNLDAWNLYERFFIPASLKEIPFAAPNGAQLLICRPPKP